MNMCLLTRPCRGSFLLTLAVTFMFTTHAGLATPAEQEQQRDRADGQTGDLDLDAAPKTGFISGFNIETSTTQWIYRPISVKESDENSDWSRVSTEEEYQIDPLHFYGATATLRTRLLDVNMRYQSNRGFGVDAGDSSYLDLLLALTGVPHLQRVSIFYQSLDFKNGKALLNDRTSSLPRDVAAFRVMLDSVEARYQLKQLMLFGRYMSYSLPRNVYLEQRIGEGENAQYIYYPISDRLMRIDNRFLMLGAGLDNKKRKEVDSLLVEQPDRRSFIFGGLMGIGGGSYDISDLRSEAEIDEGYIISLTLQLTLGYQLRFWDTLVVGLKNELSILFLKPMGLPNELDRIADQEGLDTEGLSLDFGVIEFLNGFTGFARLEF